MATLILQLCVEGLSQSGAMRYLEQPRVPMAGSVVSR